MHGRLKPVNWITGRVINFQTPMAFPPPGVEKTACFWKSKRLCSIPLIILSLNTAGNPSGKFFLHLVMWVTKWKSNLSWLYGFQSLRSERPLCFNKYFSSHWGWGEKKSFDGLHPLWSDFFRQAGPLVLE